MDTKIISAFPACGKTYAFELKGPLPNSDQTKVSKEKMFKLNFKKTF